MPGDPVRGRSGEKCGLQRKFSARSQHRGPSFVTLDEGGTAAGWGSQARDQISAERQAGSGFLRLGDGWAGNRSAGWRTF